MSYDWHEENDPFRPVELELPLNADFDLVFRWFPDTRYFVKKWCDQNLACQPDFSKEGGHPERYFGHFASDADAVLFKMRFF